MVSVSISVSVFGSVSVLFLCVFFVVNSLDFKDFSLGRHAVYLVVTTGLVDLAG